MKPHFKDPALQQQYDRDGYVLLDGMVDKPHIENLSAIFRQIEPPGLDRMYCNIYNRPAEENEKIDRAIYDAFAPRFDAVFSDCHLSRAVFLAKGNGPDTASIMHQDWNNVDETQFESLAMWTPLEDVDETNGCIYVVKGSHRMFQSVRSMTVPTLYLDFDDELEKYITPVPVKAGQALVYAHNLFHGSKPKFEGAVRAAVVIGIIPNDARTIYYFRDAANPGLVELFETNRDFYLNGISKYYDMKRPADLPKIGELHGNKFTITREEFFETMRRRHSSN